MYDLAGLYVLRHYPSNVDRDQDACSWSSLAVEGVYRRLDLRGLTALMAWFFQKVIFARMGAR